MSQYALLVHANPATPLTGYVYRDSDFSRYASVPHDVIFMGHTHRPFSVRHGGKLFVNVGSVGMPRDHGALASFALFDTDRGSCRICRVRLDPEKINAAYGARIHSSVRQLLTRRTAEPVGKLLP